MLSRASLNLSVHLLTWMEIKMLKKVRLTFSNCSLGFTKICSHLCQKTFPKSSLWINIVSQISWKVFTSPWQSPFKILVIRSDEKRCFKSNLSRFWQPRTFCQHIPWYLAHDLSWPVRTHQIPRPFVNPRDYAGIPRGCYVSQWLQLLGAIPVAAGVVCWERDGYWTTAATEERNVSGWNISKPEKRKIDTALTCVHTVPQFFRLRGHLILFKLLY